MQVSSRTHIGVKEHETVPVDGVIAIIGDKGEDISGLLKEIESGQIPWNKESVIALYDKIADEVNNNLIQGLGEIVISGPNVTPGYENNPEANAKNFFEANGEKWFRTGDQGEFDEDGYLWLTGRLKEIINRPFFFEIACPVNGILLSLI